MLCSLLAFDTSTEACSVALWRDGTVFSREEHAPQKHLSLLLPMCESVLHEASLTPANLDAIAFGQGPGSFTGVRIAAAAAYGIAAAHDLPLLPVSSLQAIAQQAFSLFNKPQIFSGIDARRQEIYAAEYRLEPAKQLMILFGQEVLTTQTLFYASIQKKYPDPFPTYAGSAFQTENILFPLAKYLLPQALDNFFHKKTQTPETALPVYLRHKITEG